MPASRCGDFAAQTLCHELEDGRDLFARHVELLDDLVDAEVFEILNHCGHGQACTARYPRASDSVGDALDGRTLRPVKRCHGPTSYPSSVRDVVPAVTLVQAAPRRPSRHRSQLEIRFQLANVWLTTFIFKHLQRWASQWVL